MLSSTSVFVFRHRLIFDVESTTSDLLINCTSQYSIMLIIKLSTQILTEHDHLVDDSLEIVVSFETDDIIIMTLFIASQSCKFF